MAVIDHGIAFAHQALRAGGATRADYCWSQSAPADGNDAALFGPEFTRAGIEALRIAHANDEDAIYRDAGLLGRVNLPPWPAHGRIIAVDLPSTALWDTSGFGTDMFLLSALHCIFDRVSGTAHGLAAVPLVVNISKGWSGGPHDGSSLLEAARAELITARRIKAATALVLPSGNMFLDIRSARIEDSHFTATPDGKSQASLRWFAAPHDMTFGFAEVWLACLMLNPAPEV